MNHQRILALGLVALVSLSGVAGLGVALSASDGPSSPATAAEGDLGASTDLAATPEVAPVDDATSNATVSVVSTRERVTFDAAKDQVLRGESTLPVGTELVVVLASDEPQDFVAIETTRVGLDGTFREELDLSHYPANASIGVYVYHEGTRVEETTARVTPEESDTRIDAEWNELDVASQHETVTGTTDLPAGTELTVTVSSAGNYGFDQTRTVHVLSDGTFEATFDLSDVPHATDFRVSVTHDGTRLDYVTGTVYD